MRIGDEVLSFEPTVEWYTDWPYGIWTSVQVLASAGEDGFDFLMSATADLVESLCKTPGDVRLTWHELPASRASGP